MTELEWIDIFGDNLRDILKEEYMSRQELSEATGITEGLISKYINKKVMPNTKNLINMAHALNISLDEFIDFGEDVH